MKNAVGRDIPEALLVNGKEVYQGKNYMDGKYLQKAAPCTRRYERPQESKIVETLADALRQCGAQELQDMIAEGKDTQVHCQFCDAEYVFTPAQLQTLLDAGNADAAAD